MEAEERASAAPTANRLQFELQMWRGQGHVSDESATLLPLSATPFSQSGAERVL